MPNPFVVDSFQWYWYEYWIALGVAIGAIVVGIHLFATTTGGGYGTTIRALAVLAFAGTMPLASERIQLGVAGDDETMFLFSALGGGGAAGLFVFHSILRFVRRNKDKESVSVAEAPSAASAPDISEAGSSQAPANASAQEEAATMMVSRDDLKAASESAPTAARPSAWLLYKSGPSAGQTVPISGDVTQIGRSASSDVVIDDATVSRDHAQIHFGAGGYELADSGSSSGTMIGGTLAETRSPLKSGDEVRFGETDLVFMQGDTPMQPMAGAGGDNATVMLGGKETQPLMACLAVTDGPSRGKLIQLGAGETTIGRGQINDLVLDDTEASRAHAMVIADGDNMAVVDLGSANGTSVNGKPIKGMKLSASSIVRIGETELSLVDVESAAEAPQQVDRELQTVMSGSLKSETGAVLIVRKGPDAGRTFSIESGEAMIGRDSSCDIPLKDDSVSRRHAVVRTVNGDITVFDLGSANGTSVDGTKLSGAPLGPGDTIVIGDSTITLMKP